MSLDVDYFDKNEELGLPRTATKVVDGEEIVVELKEDKGVLVREPIIY